MGDIQRGGVWEHRSIFLFYYDFVVDLAKLLTYSTFFGIIVKYYGVPLHIIRDLYVTMRSFIVRIRDIVRYRRATANMNERYPDATPEELAQGDRICIICREEMLSAKRLPCGHLFHFRCLRSWLERQQACPTCRRPILEEEQAEAGGDLAAARQGRLGGGADGAQPAVRVWRDGGWGAAAADDGAARPDQPPPPQAARPPAVVFPNIPEPPAHPPAPIRPEMAEIPGEIIPGPFGSVPVILIPPQQLAAVPGRDPPPPPNIGGGARPQPPLTPTPGTADRGNDQLVPPPRPHSASSAFPAPRSRDGRRDGGDVGDRDLGSDATTCPPLYRLKASDGHLANIYLEPVGEPSPIRFASSSSTSRYSMPSWPSSAHPSSHGSLHRLDLRSQILDEETLAAREHLRQQLRRELSTLSQLQVQVSSLTERLLEADARLSSGDSLNNLMSFGSSSSISTPKEQRDHIEVVGKESEEEGNVRWGKEKAPTTCSPSAE